ncbi:interleukin-1 receptor-associated kinase 4 isoform X2 [Esox lucius]|uniref:interleukin-1 receptor-associated kinase 4 isoform X2 n=1 Tax=Esox lucius TaxID=8010 RepID=UPI001476926A|nr:interleukin-1 receptor-associated kinase 4 isoform X2 [Esox lucius]
MNPITSTTFIRNLPYGVRRNLSDFLDPQESWKEVLVSIHKPTGEPRRFEAVVLQGRSPTMELLNDWGTSNSTVGELVDILISRKLLAAASILLPDAINSCLPAIPQPALGHRVKEIVYNSDDTTRPFGRTEEQPLPDCSSEPHKEHKDTAGFLRLSFDELRRVTGNFDERPVNEGGSRLGAGGFGTVYYGHINGKPVAVKKLHSTEEISLEELSVQFNQEIQTLMTLKHENLVDMVGFSCEGHHPCLLYAYMSNGSLLDRLACLDNSPLLSWHQRCLIALGTARGLDYLHRNSHVHRDVKSGNILLDKSLVPKISDFGLTRASATRSSSTVMTERIVGTTAYMANEALRGEITPKSDIYSFGVVLLEILSGQPPVDENRDPKFLMEIKDEIDEEEMTLEDFVDQKMTDWDLPSVERTYSLASDCLNDKKNKRPLTEQVLSELEDVVKSISLEELGTK